MTVHKVSDKLPLNNKYVVCRYCGGNWISRDDQEGVVWKVARFVECAAEGNNLVPYRWEEFGPATLFGQDVDFWFELPRGL